MTNLFATAGIAAFLALTSLAAPAVASASDLNPGVQLAQWGGPSHWGGGPSSSRNFCNHSTAENRARNMGLTRVRVTNVTSRAVVVEGRNRRGDWQRVTFANDRSCRVLGR